MVRSTLGTKMLRSLLRSGRAQQRSVGKLVSKLLTTAAKPAKNQSKSVKAKTVKAANATPKIVKAKAVPPRGAGLKARAAPATVPPLTHAPPGAAGKWLASHYPSRAEPGALGGKRMSYWLYLPHEAPAADSAGMPLLVMLHGCQQSATQFAQGTRMNALADKAGYAVVYPQQLLSSQAQRCWKWYDKATQEGGGDVRMLVGIIEKVAQQYRIDRRRIYICGISAGAAMAYIVALNHPELIAAAGLHSAPAFGAGHNPIGALGVMQHGAGMRVERAIHEVLLREPQFPAMPTLLIQGMGDQVVRPINQSQLTRQSLMLNRMRAGAEYKVTHKAGRGNSHNRQDIHDFYIGRKLILRVAQVARLEHAWSGGDPNLAFNAKAGPDASKMMLDFFARHRR
ncbi:PHB depolymerase family esterase [Rugamonas sp. CCM 8940]|uniref:extracellular catalytic domain type 1 short-chain-length polyhydroxyalkanoate depolymerase n=1 Tax=Rugamonas sp. CCM 8940 TaxID=2765359 RepID=UPI0018F53F9D|nr:PHB depolymerase family esterase [Rugamonas sp. CCM 8940]MBJ7311056.1 PHB depolymerase family esterase [Rugamonas sp. CCM 8940]